MRSISPASSLAPVYLVANVVAELLFWLVLSAVFGALSLMGVHDVLQRRHSILRNYPVIGHIRWIAEFVRPEIRQYLIEADEEAAPFSRSQRSLVYERAGDVETREMG